jgi:hypothetical protein
VADRISHRNGAFPGGGLEPEDDLARALASIENFSQLAIGTPLRPYQLEPAKAIVASVLAQAGHTFTVMMSRQAGKNELSAQVEAFLLTRFRDRGGAIVKAAPTFHPQIRNSVLRLERALDNPLTRGVWTRRQGDIVLGDARAQFFSGEPQSHVVGATASLLLEIDEAQDFNEEKYLKDFRPMGAATNVTTVLYGTAWTADTLLEHTREENARLEAADGIRRNFTYPWQVVAAENPFYGRFVEAEIARMGSEHPLIRTQYLLELISGAGRFLSELQLGRLGLDLGPGDGARAGEAGGPPIYVAGIDLAGEEETVLDDAALRAAQPRRDSTAVAIAQVEWRDAFGTTEPYLRLVHFYWWTGRKHRELLPTLVDALRGLWRCTAVVVDATGIGAGVASLLVGALGADVVRPFVFTSVSKSELGYQLLGAINAGRLRVPAERGPYADDVAAVAEFWRQARLARSSLHANQRLSFYVDPREGHDDLLIALALAVEAAEHARPLIATGRRAR